MTGILRLVILGTALVLVAGCGRAPQAVEPETFDHKNAGAAPPSTDHLQFGGTLTRSGFSMSRSQSGSDQSLLDLSKIGVWAADSSSETATLSREVARQLGAAPELGEVVWMPYGSKPPAGDRKPGAMFLVGVAKTTDQRRLVGRSYEMEIEVRGGSSLAASNSFYSSRNDPPISEFYLSGKGTREVNFRGLSVGDLREQHLLKAAEDVKESLLNNLTELVLATSASPALPDEFFPAFQAAPELKLMDDFKAVPVYSLRGLFMPNETLWKIPEATSTAELFAAARIELEAEGWRIDKDQPRGDGIHIFRAFREDGSEEFEIFPARGDLNMEQSDTAPQNLRYTKRLTAKDQQALLAKFIDSGLATAGQLTPFVNLIGLDHAAKAMSLLDQSYAPGAIAYLRLWKQLHRNEEIPDEIMRRVFWLNASQAPHPRFDQVLEKAGFEISEERLDGMGWWDPALLVSMGWIDLDTDPLPMERTAKTPSTILAFQSSLPMKFISASWDCSPNGTPVSLSTQQFTLDVSGRPRSSSKSSFQISPDATIGRSSTLSPDEKLSVHFEGQRAGNSITWTVKTEKP